MLLGAGLLIGLAAAAAAGGRWLLGGIVLAGALAAASAWAPGWSGPAAARPAGWRVARAVVLLALAAVLARTFGAYLVPEQPVIVAWVLLALCTVAVALGVDVPVLSRRVMAGLLLMAAVGFVAVCTAVGPPGGIVPLVLDATPAAIGVPASAAVLFALFTPLDAGVPRHAALSRVAVGTAAALAVAWAALYQVGPVRLGLADTSLREVLAAADAASLTTVLHALVALATVVALVAVLAAARAELAGPRDGSSIGPALLAGVLAAPAALLAPWTLLLAASTVALGAVFAGWMRAAFRPSGT